MVLEKEQPIAVCAYKHNGQAHRLWRKVILIEEDDEKFIVANNKTRVFEKNDISWHTSHPAIATFFKNKWFNIITIINDDNISYYCNIASPVIQDKNTLKYIDYDLDVKIFPNKKIKLLDSTEYGTNQKQHSYDDKIKKIIEYELGQLISMIKEKKDPFNDEFIAKYKPELEAIALKQK